MEITIQSVHFDATTQLKEFIEKKISKLEKISDLIINAEVVLKVIKPEVSNNKEASIKLNIKSGELFAEKIADSFEEAVVLCVEALERQVLKVKEKSSNR